MENTRNFCGRRQDQTPRYQQHLRAIFATQDDRFRHCSGRDCAESLVGGQRMGLGEYVLYLMMRATLTLCSLGTSVLDICKENGIRYQFVLFLAVSHR